MQFLKNAHIQVLLQDFKVISLLAQVTFVERDQK